MDGYVITDKFSNLGKVQNFIRFTNMMLQVGPAPRAPAANPQDEKNKDIISWNEAGDQVVIKDKDRLVSEVIPQYFRHNQYETFVRQVYPLFRARSI